MKVCCGFAEEFIVEGVVIAQRKITAAMARYQLLRSVAMVVEYSLPQTSIVLDDVVGVNILQRERLRARSDNAERESS